MKFQFKNWKIKWIQGSNKTKQILKNNCPTVSNIVCLWFNISIPILQPLTSNKQTLGLKVATVDIEIKGLGLVVFHTQLLPPKTLNIHGIFYLNLTNKNLTQIYFESRYFLKSYDLWVGERSSLCDKLSSNSFRCLKTSWDLREA